MVGIVIFLVVTSLTFIGLTPIKSTNETTNTTANMTANYQSDNSLVTNLYRFSTALATGAVISMLAVFFLKSSKNEILINLTSTEHNK